MTGAVCPCLASMFRLDRFHCSQHGLLHRERQAIVTSIDYYDMKRSLSPDSWITMGTAAHSSGMRACEVGRGCTRSCNQSHCRCDIMWLWPRYIVKLKRSAKVNFTMISRRSVVSRQRVCQTTSLTDVIAAHLKATEVRHSMSLSVHVSDYIAA